ncbi:proteasome regulatory particle base subunit, partial [Cladochytrium tenue]
MVEKTDKNDTAAEAMDIAEASEKKPDASKKDGKKDAKEEEELSEEDQQLKNELEMLVERLKEKNDSLYKPSLETLRTLIRTSTSSMTSVPKPLKFLRPHFGSLKSVYEEWPVGENKRFLADIISVLAMSYDDGQRDTLAFRFRGSTEPVGSWGHEYVSARTEKEENTEELITLALEIVPFFLKHNAEADACDLLLELENLDRLVDHVDAESHRRVCLYIVSCVPYVAPPDDAAILKTARALYKKHDEHAQALFMAMKLNDLELIQEDFNSCPDEQQIYFDTGRDDLNEILSNTRLSENFLALVRDLDVVEAKTPEDIYKTYLENTHSTMPVGNVDSARHNLASSFVNAFVNAGFGNDKLLMNTDESMMSATASLGVILLWDVEVGLTEIDKFLYSSDDNIKAGALLAIGLVNSNIRHESDPALGLLSEYVENKTTVIRVAAILGLGIAYAGSAREDLAELLLPVVSDSALSMELSSLAALSLGLIFVGTCHGDIASTILQTMMERDDIALKDPYAQFMGVGLGLLFLGKQDASDATLETLKAIEHPLGKLSGVIVEILSFIGTGNVLKVQQMLHLCSDHLDPTKEDDRFQFFAVLGVALIAMGEDVGAEMAMRTFNHLMHYGELPVRRAIPLALGLLCASNPLANVLDVLSKYSHDNDQEVSINAIFAMGLVGAGTNNARLAQMLRQLASYYSREAGHLFVVRVAQGLVHMGKGTLTINPFHSNKMLLSSVGAAGLFATLTAFSEPKTFILGQAHYLLYLLVPSMYPRFLMTLDESLKNTPVTVRVGQ